MDVCIWAFRLAAQFSSKPAGSQVAARRLAHANVTLSEVRFEGVLTSMYFDLKQCYFEYFWVFVERMN